MSKLVYGVGISEAGEFKRSEWVCGKSVGTTLYKLWSTMLQRCYSEKHQQKHPAYVGCAVSEDFKYFQRFAKWCQSQIGFGLDGYQLDKDILVRDNIVYGETTCVFVPKSINCLLTKRESQRGDYPVGVHWDKRDQKYVAKCSDGSGKSKFLGLFSTPEAAFLTYKPFKESLIKRLAIEHQSVVDPRVYDALMAYEVFITD